MQSASNQLNSVDLRAHRTALPHSGSPETLNASGMSSKVKVQINFTQRYWMWLKLWYINVQHFVDFTEHWLQHITLLAFCLCSMYSTDGSEFLYALKQIGNHFKLKYKFCYGYVTPIHLYFSSQSRPSAFITRLNDGWANCQSKAAVILWSPSK